ncbi:hypothetical protein Bca52824_051898 [Brassica carinata]|uniref:Clp ATPase C-terminal domain-containing protein n=1 Tax=Brassica carinata TaxID=52824 RepID=A0A8X7R3P3_BRACI|nr:hypothetical protein Bca52824_051898 [Brassica carinata]
MSKCVSYELMMLKLVGKLGPREKPTGLQPKQADDDMVLTEPKNALGKQYKKMYQMNSVKLHFTETALRLLARKAITKNTGARGLRPLLESILMDSIKQLKEKGRRGSGAKILRGKGALVLYLSEAKSTYSPQLQTTKEGSEGEKEVEQEIPSVVASM